MSAGGRVTLRVAAVGLMLAVGAPTVPRPVAAAGVPSPSAPADDGDSGDNPPPAPRCNCAACREISVAARPRPGAVRGSRTRCVDPACQ